MPYTPSLIALSNSYGTLSVVRCVGDGASPRLSFPVLSLNYKKEARVRELISRGAFKKIRKSPYEVEYLEPQNTPDKELFNFSGIEQMQNYLREHAMDVACIYFFVDDKWTCAKVEDYQIIPLDVAGIENVKVDEEYPTIPKDEWIKTFFPRSIPAAKIPVASRMTKAEWLRQHYPELSELPKWRFPAMVAG
jgi:hypothetical protein